MALYAIIILSNYKRDDIEKNTINFSVNTVFI